MESKIDTITVEQFFEDNKEALSLVIAGGFNGMKNIIKTTYVNIPSLLFIGFNDMFTEGDIQILGKREMLFLNTLNEEEREKALNMLFSFSFPCIIITDNEKPFENLKRHCNEKEIPLFVSSLDIVEFYKNIESYLYDKLAPYIVINGTLMDVYGIGLLFTGESGVGKSEAALDLISRGHRFIADDVVKLKRRGRIVIGEGIEPSEIAKYHMEIRGVGIVNIGLIYGIRALRLHKRVEVIIRLTKWKEDEDWTRTGLESEKTNILGLDLPLVQIPLVPGKNIATISELVALNHILKIVGYDTPKILNEELMRLLRKEGKNIARLEEDEE